MLRGLGQSHREEILRRENDPLQPSLRRPPGSSGSRRCGPKHRPWSKGLSQRQKQLPGNRCLIQETLPPTALPHPPNTNQKVPTNSAVMRFVSVINLSLYDILANRPSATVSRGSDLLAADSMVGQSTGARCLALRHKPATTFGEFAA